jgi:PPM family protein phosphatase
MTHFLLQVATASHPGRVRARNEDAVAVRPEVGLVVVADGMGGHAAGDKASALAVEEVVRGLGVGSAEGNALLRVEGAVRAAHQRVLDAADLAPDLRGMGTTLTVLLLDRLRGSWVVGHVGDSRAYLFRKGGLRQVTRDQTWVQDQVDMGHLDLHAAAVHPLSSLLLQAIGSGNEVAPEMVQETLVDGDLFLLCSDGLIRVVEDSEIQAALAALERDGNQELQETVDALVDLANHRGGPDNVTIALARVTALPR